MTSGVRIYDDTEELAWGAAKHIADAATRSVAERGRFSLCLSGGDTPAETYTLLGGELANSIPWDRVHVFWGDERCIPLDRPDNHFAMASRLVLSRVSIPSENVHRMCAEAGDPNAAAAEYESTLRAFFDHDAAPVPAFDLILLGMGEDGHIASLFPGSDGYGVRSRWVVDHDVIKRGEVVHRLSLTMPVLAGAREILVLVSGDLKADMLASVLRGGADVPARELNAVATNICWMVDRAAGAVLEPVAVGGSEAP